MSSDGHIEKARTWYFKAPRDRARLVCPAIDCFNQNLFIAILDNRKSTQMASIFIAPSLPFQVDQAVGAHAARAPPPPPTQRGGSGKADTVCFSATESDPTHAAVEGFIHSGAKVSLETVERWLNHQAMQESVQ